MFSESQVDVLLRPIMPQRVVARDGQKYVEAYDIRAHLIRLFGFGGWSGEVIDSTLLYEEVEASGKDDKPRVSVGYRVRYRLTILVPDFENVTYTEEATGDAINFPKVKRADAHDFAVKTAASQAMKRCAMNLGDQFGLSLYSRTPDKPLVKALVAATGAEIEVDPVTAEAAELPADWRTQLDSITTVEDLDVAWQSAIENGWIADPVVELAFAAKRKALG